MKKFLTLALVCCLVFSSSSTVFATATQWDTSDQANLRYISQSVTSGGSLYSLVNNIYSYLNTINNTLTDIEGFLYYGNRSIANWVASINSWMSPIYGRLADIITNTLNIDSVAGLLGSTDVVDGTTVRTPYLFYGGKSAANWLSDLYNATNKSGTSQFYSPLGTMEPWNINYTDATNMQAQYFRAFSQTFARMYAGQHQGLGSNMGSFNLYSQYANALNTTYVSTDDLLKKSFSNISQTLGTITAGYLNTRHILSWLTLEDVTPSEQPKGFAGMIEDYLEAIQNPVARLSYVLASDERIEAQEKAAENEQAVVDNFIDSSGSGAASTSDFGSVSNLSSGFKNNIATDASVSGIWNIFNADNFGWFSQETANQLDTSGSGKKTSRSSGSYPTPLLDKQTEDIMKILGGEDND